MSKELFQPLNELLHTAVHVLRDPGPQLACDFSQVTDVAWPPGAG